MLADLRRSSIGFALLGLSVIVPACGSDRDGFNDDVAPPSGEAPVPTTPGEEPVDPKALVERPWEIVSNKGETFLPNVFYAEPSENEQIMPYAIDGHTMIDRLVYPTLGNPNLYVKGDPNDELIIVLRIEDEAYAHLGAKIEPIENSNLSRLVVKNEVDTGFAFELIERKGRDPWTTSTDAVSTGNDTGVHRIYPNEIIVTNDPPDLPAALKKRRTVRFVFKQGAMGRVPAGLYDVRFEVRKEKQLYLPKPGGRRVFEYQYNAVRVFDTEPEEYNVLNVTDTQVSIGSAYGEKTKDKLDEFVRHLNTTNDPSVKSAAFITFNGDLHNGGSPASLRQRTVAGTYLGEAKEIVNALKDLPVPIFLTAGNHDGYVATGHVPSAVKALDTGLGESLAEVIIDAKDRPWEGFSITAYQDYLKKTEAADQLGGIHRDIFTGGFARSAKSTSFEGWKEIPKADRNYILYDGFYQWQKTYGPLYFSWKFGKSFYLSLNSYELRQHRRSGWGMYTVNYGGGMSQVQMAWLDRELLRAKADKSDVVVLAHHDPRGGHKGKDFGYYFEQLEYRSVFQSAINYLVGKVWNPAVCKLPDWALPREQQESCVHDGLQEWMRGDPEYDMVDGQLWMSGIELMKRLAASKEVRTFLLGHTHYNSLEVLQSGDELLPGKLPIDGASAQKFATLEVENPMRGFSVLKAGVETADYDEHALASSPVEKSYFEFARHYEKAVSGWQRTLSDANTLPRELMVLRLVSNADLTHQTTTDGKEAFGFTVLHLTKKNDARAYGNAQINGATFFRNAGQSAFSKIAQVDLDRTKSLKPHDAASPIEKLFDW